MKMPALQNKPKVVDAFACINLFLIRMYGHERPDLECAAEKIPCCLLHHTQNYAGWDRGAKKDGKSSGAKSQVPLSRWMRRRFASGRDGTVS
jgi:hypothetical protein